MESQTPSLALSDDEAMELHRFTINAYLDPNKYPALCKLIARVDIRVHQLRGPQPPA